MSKKKPVRYFDKPTSERDPGRTSDELTDEESKNREGRLGGRDWRKNTDPFPGPAPIGRESLQKYKRGEANSLKRISFPSHKTDLRRKEETYDLAARQAARSELLLPEDAGFLEADEGQETYDVTQEEIRKAVDIASATKNYELRLNQFGPYRMDFTRNGRHLLIGGRKGHLASFDWLTKKLHFEINVMETIQDVQWLHLETMCAVAQKKWLYMYDNNGVELHCVKTMHSMTRLEFLPYHFLLVGCSSFGGLQYLDVSVGKMVCDMSTKSGRLDVMTQNPQNAVIHLGHANGTVSMWSPNCRQPLVKMLCHKSGVRSVAVDKEGLYMATGGMDRRMKIFDLRTYKPLQAYTVPCGAAELCFSQRGLLAAACFNVVEVYKNCRTTQETPYMMHSLRHPISNIGFCPYEDVLGVAHSCGYASLLIPGAGEPNFDALETNPYQSKTQRKEHEVKALLEKIQPDMITLDPSRIGAVDKATVQQRMEEKKELFGLEPPPKVEPRKRMKGSGKAQKREQRKQGIREEDARKKRREEVMKVEKKKSVETSKRTEDRSALDRFKK